MTVSIDTILLDLSHNTIRILSDGITSTLSPNIDTSNKNKDFVFQIIAIFYSYLLRFRPPEYQIEQR